MKLLFARRCTASIVVCSLFAAGSLPALEISIELEDHGHNPLFDPNGQNLRAMFNLAADYWESMISEGGSHTIDVWWEPVVDGQNTPVLGRWSETANPIGDNDIRVNPNFNWYIDQDPFDSSEYDFSNTAGVMSPYFGIKLYRDLSTLQKSNWFSGDTPRNLLEVGYIGNAMAGTQAEDRYDLFTLVLHEMGHELGLNSGDSDSTWELLTLPYFFANKTGGHIAAEPALMWTNISPSTRRLPSTTDILTVAHLQSTGFLGASRPTKVDLPRKYFYSGTDWNATSGWIGKQVPDSLDEVWILEAQTVTLSDWGYAGSLAVDEESQLLTASNKLAVAGLARITGEAEVTVGSGGEFEAAAARIEAMSRLTVNAGGLIGVTNLQIDANGVLNAAAGTSTLFIRGQLNNNGTIAAINGGHLTLSTEVPAPWDLDGSSENGVIDARFGDITMATGNLTDLFSGTMQVGQGQTVHFAAPWFIDKSGLVRLHGGVAPGDRALLSGSSFGLASTDSRLEVQGLAYMHTPYQHVLGTLALFPTATLELNAPTILEGGVIHLSQGANLNLNDTISIGGNIAMTTNSTSPTLGDMELNGFTTYQGGTLTLQGLVRQDGDATVVGTTIMSVAGVFDMDGSNTIPAAWSVSKPLVISSDYVELISAAPQINPHNVVNSTISITHAGSISFFQPDGSLTINLSNNRSWQMAGTINLDGSTSTPGNIIPVMVAGSPVTFTGSVNIKDRVAIGAQHSLAGYVVFEPGASLYLSGRSLITPIADFVGSGQVISTSDRLTVQHDAYVGVPLTTHGPLEVGFVDTVGMITALSLTVGSAGSLVFDLAGTSAVTQYDRLKTTGSLQLGGTLKVELLGDYVPSLGSAFDLLDWGTLTGTFGSLDLPQIYGRGWDTSQLYTTGVISLIEVPLLPGDYNQDGLVDLADYTVWRNNLGRNTALPNDDTPGVGADDYARWKLYFGTFASSGLAAEADSTVSEPGAAMLLILAAACCALHSRAFRNPTRGDRFKFQAAR